MQHDYLRFVDGGEPTVGWREAPTQLVQLPTLSDISSQSVTNYTLPHADYNHKHSLLLFGDRDDSVICFVDQLVKSYVESNSLHRSLEQMSILPISTLN